MAIEGISPQVAMDIQGMDRIKQINRDNPDEGLRQAAEQFEAYFINVMLKSMREAGYQDDQWSSSQMETFQEMHDQELSSHLAGRGFGLAEQLIEQLASEPRRAPESAVTGVTPVTATSNNR